MSTKIYNGYVLPAMTAVELTQFTIRVRGVMNEVRNEMVRRLNAAYCYNILDALALGKKISGNVLKPNQRLAFAGYWYIHEQVKLAKTSELRGKGIPLECSVVFLPQDNRILTVFYAEKDGFHSAWRSLPEVKEYGYWNNTDQPDNVTDEEWAERRQSWDSVLLQNKSSEWIPSMNGLVADLVDPMLPLVRTSEILQYIPSVEARAREWAKSIVRNRRYNLNVKNSQSDKKDINWTAFHNSLAWMSTPEGQKAINSQAKSIQKKLKETYTQEEFDIEIAAEHLVKKGGHEIFLH